MATYETEQKKELIGFLTRNRDKAFSIEDICKGMERDSQCINPPGRSTVYRLVPKLVADNTIKQFSLGTSTKAVFQIVGGVDCHAHMHLKCTQCGKIFHMNMEASKELSKEIEELHDFKVSAGDTTIFGLCRGCSRV